MEAAPESEPEPASEVGEATRLLGEVEQGKDGATQDLLGIVYGELRSLAGHFMDGERANHTLQPTALVHEVWMRLIDGGVRQRWESRAHFVRVAAQAMRNVLVDHARAKKAGKRGGGASQVALDEVLAGYEERSLDVLAVHGALERLTKMDPELARLIELRFFGGLTIPETAEILGTSTPTVERRWRVARMWLSQELADDE